MKGNTVTKAEASDVLAELAKCGCIIDLTGSQAICEPPPAESDTDYLVFAPSEKACSDAVATAAEHDFNWEGSEHYQHCALNTFMSWRKEKLNLIITRNEDFAQKHRLATKVCKKLNLLNKDHRITVFQAILYGKDYDNDKN